MDVVAKQLTQDVVMIANAVTTDAATAADLEATTVVSGSSFYYSAVAEWAIADAVVTTDAIIVVSGSFFYYSSVAVSDVVTDVVAIMDAVANFITGAGMVFSPLL